MIRMEIALSLVLLFIGYMYFSAEKQYNSLHVTFQRLLISVQINLLLDGATVYTVNHLDTVPPLLNAILHRLFLGTLVFCIYLFYRYVSILMHDKSGRQTKLDIPARVFLILALLGNFLLPLSYTETAKGNYSSGPYVYIPYAAVAFYLVLCSVLMVINRKNIEIKNKITLGIVLFIELWVSILQAFNPTWLISGMGLTLMALCYYLTLENPEALKAELTEQKLSMLYLKSQVNPHFLYNTLDTIRIQAQLNGDKEVSNLLMKLVDFFRASVKVDRSIVTLDDEMDMLENYMDLMCYRYPGINCEYDIDPDLGGVQVPNFILQPIVENSLLHGLKNKGYKGNLIISAQKVNDSTVEISVKDSGTGFPEDKKELIDNMLKNYAKHAPKLTGNSIGLLNVQKRIKLLCGAKYGLSYTDNESGGVTAHILLPFKEEVK
ncbi:MAG: histidine kinase [Clostridia bacterium]|nr:histidine kinase [Clostridia bacterium]